MAGLDPIVFGSWPRVSLRVVCWYCGSHGTCPSEQGPVCINCLAPINGEG